MTDKKDKFECKSCGQVKEQDTGWAEAKDPAPEVNVMAMMPEPPEVEPVDETKEDSEYIDVGLGYALGDCDECGGSTWQRVSLGILEKDDPESESSAPEEDLPTDKGFQDGIPPSPEVSHATVMMSDTYSVPEKEEGKKPPSEKPEPNEEPIKADGVTGFHQAVPLGPEDHQNPLIPPDIDFPEDEEEKPGTKEDEEESGEPKDSYKCDQCGDKIELELGQEEIPSCSVCGHLGWQKESF